MKHKSLLLALISICLISCTNRNPIYHIGVSQCSEDAWRETLNSEIKLEAALAGNIEISISSVRDDSEQQIKEIERFIEQKVDLLIVAPNESEALTPVISKAYDSGIPIILVDRKTANDKYTAFVGGDNRQIGIQAASYLTNTVSNNQATNIFIVRGYKGATADIERYEGFVTNLPPSAEIVGEVFCDFQEENAQSTLFSLLRFNAIPEGIDAIFALNDAMAIGVYTAYDQYRKTENPNIQTPFLMGVDALWNPNGGQQAIIDGKIDASFIYPTGGTKVMELARKILNSEPFNKENKLSTMLVNDFNVNILQLQAAQLSEQQQKLEELNKILDINLDKFETQRQTSSALIILVFICCMFIIILFHLNRQKKELNAKLLSQNDMIHNQLEGLETQKQQLIEISNRLEETTQAKLAFFTNISHEFKTPLSLITGPMRDLLADRSISINNRQLVEIMYRNTNKLERLIAELLDFRSTESNNMAISYSMGNLSLFLQKILSLFEDIIKRRSLSFSFNDNGKDYFIPFDPKKIEKVFTNLLSNAFNHVDKSGTIKINLNRSDSELILSVFNSGSYIPESQRDKIFRNFYTLDADQKGTGIGLALVCAIVDSFQGTVSVDSLKDEGTTFIVNLPLPSELMADNEIAKDYILSFAQQKYDTMVDEIEDDLNVSCLESDKPIILVIEDNYDMRTYIKGILNRDYNVILASNGDSGIEKALSCKPALIISDILMPQKDGYEVCSTLKSNKATDYIPIILLTACSFDAQRAKGYECGADAYIQKPFDVNVLKIRISKLLERNRAISAAIKGDWLIGFDADNYNSSSINLLEKIRTYVEEHLDGDIDIDGLSQYLGMSKSKLYRELKEVTEYSPIDLANMIKLKKAIDLIIYKEYNISQAAFSSGFSSAAYFSRLFKKFYHETPSEYIARNTKASDKVHIGGTD